MSTPTLPTGMITTLVAWQLNWVAEDFAAQDVALTGARGSILFEPTAVAVNFPDTTVLPAPVETRVADGVMRLVRLTANDPEVWNWKVTPRIGVPWEPFHIDVPADEIRIDLAQVAAVPGKGPIRAVTGPRGPQGASLTSLEQVNDTVLRGTIDDPATGQAEVRDYILPRGPVGPGNSLSIGTVARGETASVSITGASPSQTLDFVLPRGEQGLPGVNAVPADEAVAGYITSSSQTSAALEAAYRAHVSVMEYGAVGDGVVDDSVAVADALAAGAGGTVYFPPGHYLLTSNFNIPAGTTISGGGSAATLLDWSTKPAFDSGFFLSWEQGWFTDPTSLAADTVIGDVSVTVAAGHPFEVGDWVRLRADDVVWGEATRAEYQRILAVDDGVLTFSGPVFDTYLMQHNAVIEKAELPSGGIHDLSIRGLGINPEGYGDTAVHAGLVRDFTVQDVHFLDVENKCILLNSVLGASISNCFFRFDPSFTPLQYGVAVTGGCQMISIRGCSSWNDRHLVTTSTSGTLTSEYRGIPRVLTITGCTAHGSWQSPIDTHRGGEYITITGNSLSTESTGVKIRGRSTVVSGNSIVGKRTSLGGGSRGVYIGMAAQDTRITGNLISGFDEGVRLDSPDTTTRHLVVSDNSIVDVNQGVHLAASTLLSEVQLIGNTIRVLDSGVGVRFTAPTSDVEIVSNTLTGGHTAIHMGHPTNRVDRLMVHGNTCRGQSTRAMFFRWVYDGLIVGNFSPGAQIRFSDECLRVTTGLNQATITDLTSGTTIVQK